MKSILAFKSYGMTYHTTLTRRLRVTGSGTVNLRTSQLRQRWQYFDVDWKHVYILSAVISGHYFVVCFWFFVPWLEVLAVI